ncbi:leucine-rich repeat transmembrane protein FLRT1-like [Erpetoichthys calabaricus]|uniref:leucine-rich repeat transmembrane protein FLRT1-like n=1 Tax=Erpetoichthys calabaricus TaxID=27687 RepID=UPI0022344753|nr:leucine-rich repeat transmembrane protein FLRT1-like [Erpetoichthys calabaricus]XP_051778904.1 leucine-rich repeat transmembrane protein FLRT1-like [Erpetoichthys calabaricus]
MAVAAEELHDWLFLCLLLLTFLAEALESSIHCPHACRCDTGFIYCNDRGLTAIPPDIPDDATVLYLQNNQINNAGVPSELSTKTNVRVIYLYENDLDEFPINLPRSLRELHLQDNNIRSLPRDSLARIPLLEKLHLDDNSVSTVSIEDDAFADSKHLRLLFLSRNHLSSIPSGLPHTLEELRLDDNRIFTIPQHAFKGLSSLRRLVMDGNLLANQRIADDTFSRLQNLTELSLVRNSLLAPPLNLPTAHLQKLYLQDNAIGHIPYNTLNNMRQLQRLDLSNNNLTTLPRGLFDDLDSLSQLLLRNNPWHCGCNLMWLRDWVKIMSLTVNVRGLMCQSPDRVRGMAIKDITTEMDDCLESGQSSNSNHQGGTKATLGAGHTTTTPQGSLFTLKSKRPGLRLPDANVDYPMTTGAGTKNLMIKVKPLTPDSIHITWKTTVPVSSFRLSWLRLGHSPAVGSITETLVQGDRTEYLLTALEPKSTYIICMVTMEVGSSFVADETPVCAKAETSEAHDPTSTGNIEPDSDHLAALPLAGIIGGATALVSLLLIFAIFCWYGHKSGFLFAQEQSYTRGSRKADDYVESGTKKDTTILEIRGPGFQMMPLNNQQQPRAKEDFVIHTIFPSNGTSLYKSTHTIGYGTNRGYRDAGIPDIDYAYT